MKTKAVFKNYNLLKFIVFIWCLFSFVFPTKCKETYRLLFIRHCFET